MRHRTLADQQRLYKIDHSPHAERACSILDVRLAEAGLAFVKIGKHEVSLNQGSAGIATDW